MSKLQRTFISLCYKRKKWKNHHLLSGWIDPSAIESMWGAGGKQISHLFNRNLTQMLTCALSLLRDQKIYEEYWVCVQTTTSAGHIIHPTWEQRRKRSTLSSTSWSVWRLSLYSKDREEEKRSHCRRHTSTEVFRRPPPLQGHFNMSLHWARLGCSFFRLWGFKRVGIKRLWN